MATLDVLDYTTRLEEALEGQLPRGDRRQAAREARNVLELMAFRFAFMDERPMPEEEDWARALEAMKTPANAAEVLVKRAPLYRKRRIRRRITSLTILVLLVGLGVVVAQVSSSLVATPLLDHNASVGTLDPRTTVTRSDLLNFTVPEGTTRLDVTVHGVVTEGYVNVTVMDPQARMPLNPPFDSPVSFHSESPFYRRATLQSPQPGEWNVVIDYAGAIAGIDVQVQAIHPRG